MPEPDENETEEERFDRLYKARRAAEDAQAETEKKLKGLGLSPDALAVIGDAVADAFERRAADRAKAKEEADQPPSTSGKRKGGGLFGLIPAANDE